MTTTSRLHRAWADLRRVPGRTPLRVKMITALLALVAIALVIISAVGLMVFRGYQVNRASQQVISLYNSEIAFLTSHPQHNPIGGPPQEIGGYLIAILPRGTSLPAAQQSMAPGASVPDVPTSTSWLRANQAKLVNVPAVSGGDNWRIIERQLTVFTTDGLTGQTTSQQATLIVGVDLGDINGTIGQLARIDLLISIIVVLALALVGVYIVRSSLRPLTDIEQTAEAIAAGDLSRRVPDLDPRTEVGRLGRSLNAMLARIESSFRAQASSEAAARRSEERMRQFVADASHELRTPLTAMRGYAEYYRQRGGVRDDGHTAPAPEAAPNGSGQHRAAQLSPADMDRIMQRVEQESARMGVLVEDMLLLARLDQQRPLERRPVDLLTLAADAVQDARMIAPDRPIDLKVGSATAFLVLGDEVRLRQVIGNLMSNALDHTPAGTPIEVRILAGPREPVPSLVLEVTDQGPGMSPEQAERVFERFYRGDQARTRTAGGTGLGLAIVAALVAAHGGSVALRTAPGEGATFRITLPLAPEAQRDDADAAAEQPSSSPTPRT